MILQFHFQLIFRIHNFYYAKENKHQTLKKVYLWAKKILFKSFDFKIFTMLLDKNKTIDKKIITALT